MLFAVLVVEGDVLLEAVGHLLVGNDHLAVRGADHDVENVEQLARVAARKTEQRAGLLDFDFAVFQFGVGLQRPVEQRAQVLVLHRFEDVDLAAAQKRRNDLERGVLGRGADERDDALLHGAQERILLRFVETVDFVDEEERRPLVEEALLACRFDHLAHLLDARRHGREGEERTFELGGDDARQRGLAHARRAPQDERRHVARLEELAEDAVLAHEMLLSDVFVHRTGSQAFGQGC